MTPQTEKSERVLQSSTQNERCGSSNKNLVQPNVKKKLFTDNNFFKEKLRTAWLNFEQIENKIMAHLILMKGGRFSSFTIWELQ